MKTNRTTAAAFLLAITFVSKYYCSPVVCFQQTTTPSFVSRRQQQQHTSTTTCRRRHAEWIQQQQQQQHQDQQLTCLSAQAKRGTPEDDEEHDNNEDEKRKSRRTNKKQQQPPPTEQPQTSSSSSSDSKPKRRRASTAAAAASDDKKSRTSKRKQDNAPETTTIESSKASSLEAALEKSIKVSQKKQQEQESTSSSSSNDSSSSETSDNNITKQESEEAAEALAFERKIRAVKAQAEIDRILNGPDPPFDIETELKRVTSISPNPAAAADATTTSTTTTAQQHQQQEQEHHQQQLSSMLTDSLATAAAQEQELDWKESQLEKELYQAVKRQDYHKAAAIKHEIRQLHIDDYCSVLAVNSEFYRAFSNKDLSLMESLWLKDDTTTCIHPSCKPLLGASNVLKSWSKMFEQAGKAAAKAAAERSWMEPQDIRLSIKGATMAVITCEEHVFVRRFVRGQKRHNELMNKLVATNIFRKVNGRWFLFYHHASWHADSEAAKTALRTGRAGGSLVSPTSSSSSAFTANRKSILSQRPPRSVSMDDDDATASASFGMDGILGTSKFGPILGASNGKGSNAANANAANGGSTNPDGTPHVKRIFMGSLSDILNLNGNIGDILGSVVGDDDDDDDEDGGDESTGTLHLSFSQIDDDDDDDDDDDRIEIVVEEVDDDDDDDEDDDEDDRQWRSTSTSSQSSSKSLSSRGSSTPSISSSSSSLQQQSSSSSSSSSPPKSDTIRQGCITALRKLCEQGLISTKHKRVLLTDIITCSAKGEFSMVEVAYELLLADNTANANGTAESTSTSPPPSTTTTTTIPPPNGDVAPGGAVSSDKKSNNNNGKAAAAAALNPFRDVAEEEFAEQCRVFASSLSERAAVSSSSE